MMQLLVKLSAKFCRKFLSQKNYEKVRAFYRAQVKNFFQKTNAKARKYYLYKIRFPTLYRRHSKEAVNKKKVIIIEPTKATLSPELQKICDLLAQEFDFDIHIHFLRHFFLSKKLYIKRCETLIKDIATAKYVFTNEAVDVFSGINLRQETQFANVWHGCGAFKKFGMSTADKIFGSSRTTLEKYPPHRCCSFVTVSSPEVRWAYAEAMNLPIEKILPLGISRTDIFFDETFVQKSRKRLDFLFPEARGKKIILYAPTFRGRVAKAHLPKWFSIPRFYEALSDDYVLICKHHPYLKKRPAIPEKYRSFAVDFTDVLNIENLLCLADICISDYSSLVFEYSLFERPILFFNFDMDEYNDWRGFYYDYDEMTPGPCFNTNRAMIDYIQHIDERFDRQRVIDFKNKFMSSCDGHSTERLFSQMFGDDLAKHKKSAQKETNSRITYFPAISVKEDTLDDGGHAEPMTRESLREKYPQIEGKTIIAYCVKNRKEVGYPKTNPYLRLGDFFEEIDDPYILLIQCDSPSKKLKARYREEKIIVCDREISMKELVDLADLVVVNGSITIADYCRKDKTTIVYMPDFRWYCDSEDQYLSLCDALGEKTFFTDTIALCHALNHHDYVGIKDENQFSAYCQISKIVNG